MKQHSYVFTAGVTSSQMRSSPGLRGGKSLQTWDSCMTAIVYGGDVAGAQKTFADWCGRSGEGEDPVETEILALVGAELVQQLLTESGGQPLDWAEISRKLMESVPKMEAEAEAPAAVEDLGEGYWVDANQTVPPESALLDLELVKRALPDDVCSALNWSPDKKFIFLVSTLGAPPVVTDLNEEIEGTDSDGAGERERAESRPVLDSAVSRLPEMREKEAVALVEARNSVEAAWLWRIFAAAKGLATNEILVNPCCVILPAA